MTSRIWAARTAAHEHSPRFRAVLDVQPERPSFLRHLALIYFAEEDGHLLLWQFATDPDAWRYMEFEKTGA